MACRRVIKVGERTVKNMIGECPSLVMYYTVRYSCPMVSRAVGARGRASRDRSQPLRREQVVDTTSRQQRMVIYGDDDTVLSCYDHCYLL